MKTKERIFKIQDIDCDLTVEIVNKQKDIFDSLDEYIENCQYEWYDTSDDSFEILYTNGTSEHICSDYDGHKIKRNGILSMVHNNPCTAIVYGNFSINEYGVVHPSEVEEISDNIKEV